MLLTAVEKRKPGWLQAYLGMADAYASLKIERFESWLDHVILYQYVDPQSEHYGQRMESVASQAFGVSYYCDKKRTFRIAVAYEFNLIRRTPSTLALIFKLTLRTRRLSRDIVDSPAALTVRRKWIDKCRTWDVSESSASDMSLRRASFLERYRSGTISF